MRVSGGALEEDDGVELGVELRHVAGAAADVEGLRSRCWMFDVGCSRRRSEEGADAVFAPDPLFAFAEVAAFGVVGVVEVDGVVAASGEFGGEGGLAGGGHAGDEDAFHGEWSVVSHQWSVVSPW